MGRSKKPRVKKTDSESDEGDLSKSVVFLSSSDDEEANKDLSMEIIQRARERELKRKRAEEGGAISIASASSEDFQTNFDQSAAEEKNTKKKHKRKSKEKKKIEEEPREATEMAVDASIREEEHAGTTDSVITEVNDVSDNVVLRMLLRGPRYFNPSDKTSEACFNCGEEGHTAANCTLERRKRPCFVCGMFGHNAKHCTQGQDCFICKRRGHIAKNCPDRHNRTQDSTICLRCGDLGHDMLSCKNDYAPDDLKEIQCYICKNYGHLCCADFTDNGPKAVSCYNCAQSGHTGLGCAKPRGGMFDVAFSTLCYKCGEEGHFARGCTKLSKFLSKAKHIKFDQWDDGFSTPQNFVNENRDSLGFRSVPHDYGKANKKKKKLQDEDRWNMTSDKSRVRGGWIVDDPADLPRRKHKSNSWKSTSTPVKKSQKAYSPISGGQNSGSRSPFKKRKSFLGTPNSNSSRRSHHHGYSAARYGKSHDYYGRS